MSGKKKRVLNFNPFPAHFFCLFVGLGFGPEKKKKEEENHLLVLDEHGSMVLVLLVVGTKPKTDENILGTHLEHISPLNDRD